MNNAPSSDVVATVSASMGRRILGIGCLAVLGMMQLYLAVATSPALGWKLFLFVLGAGALFVADMMRRSTSMTLELTEHELREAGGDTIVLLDEITSIDRGAFAFKPSNGFLLRLRSGTARHWRPGLWWGLGRRIGVGGMTPANQTKNMAEIIAIIIAKRGD